MTNVNAKGNIEDRLNVVLYEQRHTMKYLCKDMAEDVLTERLARRAKTCAPSWIATPRSTRSLGIQFLWTEMMEERPGPKQGEQEDHGRERQAAARAHSAG